MSNVGSKLKLAAVFSADVVSYSGQMGEDESATVKTLDTYDGVMFSQIKKRDKTMSKFDQQCPLKNIGC